MDEQLTSGLVLRQTFSVYFSNFLSFSLISTLVLLPVLAVSALQFAQVARGEGQSVGLSLLAGLLSILLGPVVTAALTYGVFQQIRGKPATLLDCIGTGFRLLPSVLGVSIITGLAIIAGAVLCFFPGFIVACALAAAVPAAVIERPGVFAALHRSRTLTEGHRWSVFGAIFGIWLLQIFGNLSILGLSRLAPVLVRSAISLILMVVFSTLQATAPALIYYHLRRIKESIDVAEIVAVFD